MKVRQLAFDNPASVTPQAWAALQAIQPDLLICFAAPPFFANGSLADTLQHYFPTASRMGCSTAGEISQKGVSDNAAVITALQFDKIRFKIASTPLANMDDSAAAGQRLAQQLLAPDLKAVILLSQGVGVNGSEVIAGATSLLGSTILLTGGLAGDNGAFNQTWSLHDQVVSNRNMLGLGLYGEAVGLAHGSYGGWQSFGPVRVATRANGNILYELDREPALAVYKRYLGEYAKELPASGLLFPFALLADDHQESGLIRTLLGINEDDGSLILAGDIPEKSYLRLMHASTEALVDGAEIAAQTASKMLASQQETLALLVSCIGRKLVMGDRVDEEIEAVSDVFGPNCILTGFYSNGEISPYINSNECMLHNQTMTITYLAERD